MERITRHVGQLPGPEHGRYPSGSPLVVSGPDGRVAIDSAVGVTLPDVDTVLLSHHHEDHVVGVARLGLPVWIHELDHPAVASWQGFTAACGYTSDAWHTDMQQTFGWEPIGTAKPFDDHFTLDLGGPVRVRCVPLPGHTPGHCGFWIEPDNVLYLGDIDLSSFGPFYGDATSSLTATRRSLARVNDIDANTYITFHHKGHVESPAAFRAALSHHAAKLESRSAAILDLLAHGPRTPTQFEDSGVVFRPGTHPSYGHEAETRMCRRHLDELVDAGLLNSPDTHGRYSRRH